MLRKIAFYGMLLLAGNALMAQKKDAFSYVDPFIGTARSDVHTRWGNEGGTYPGAVAPWGYMQLSPETKQGKGYDYADSEICYFSCVGHPSGYPNGSAGQLRVMPVRVRKRGAARDEGALSGRDGAKDEGHGAKDGRKGAKDDGNGAKDEGKVADDGGNAGTSTGAGGAGVTTLDAGAGREENLVGMARHFMHADEYAKPGYYRVKFRDDGTVVEATASVRVGVFRFTFAAGVVPAIYIGGAGPLTMQSDKALLGTDMPAAFGFSAAFTMQGGLLYFSPARSGSTTITMWVSVSPMGGMDAAQRIGEEVGHSGGAVREGMGSGVGGPGGVGAGALGPVIFDEVRKKTQAAWRKSLAVVEIDDPREGPKKIFYTAMYHTMLLPWIVSNTDGFYKGPDGQVHKAGGKDHYGSFSPWDTFRSLHPLMTLLFPDRQRDMLLSLMDMYQYGGRISSGPMTGDHAVPVIVDSWLKGIKAGDSGMVYTALRKGLADTPYAHADREPYLRKGYISLSYPESVTRTVEYAYDDWCLSEFAGKVMHRAADAGLLAQRGDSYQHLFDPETFFLLPRDEVSGFRRRLGTSGYKEGDPWVYSYFAPQHPGDLVNRMGGQDAFADRLDSALLKEDIIFDNETVFHIPYLFNYAGRPDRTQAWIIAIRDGRYTGSPGGLPGNDDMGSMSSWYIFSAMGFYPVCPGRPAYDIGTPLFRNITLHLASGRRFVINAASVDGRHKYVQGVTINGERSKDLFLSHDMIVDGGRMDFTMGLRPAGVRAAMRQQEEPRFSITDLSLSKAVVMPNEEIRIRYGIKNTGAPGTKIIRLMADDREVGRRHCQVNTGTALMDSIGCRLYRPGRVRLKIDGVPGILEVEVTAGAGDPRPEITELSVIPLLKKGQMQQVSYTVRNIGGRREAFPVSMRINGAGGRAQRVVLDPGEARTLSDSLPAKDEGIHTVQIGDAIARYKVYGHAAGSLLLELRPDSVHAGDSLVRDWSGFGNDGRIMGGTNKAAASMGGVDDAGAGSSVDAGLREDTGKNRGQLHFGKDTYIEVPNATGLDQMGETITMMAWVYPAAPREDLVDIFTKGDNHVLQVADNKSLTFFAGGWGRGDCTVKLPDDWFGHWHHIAGVCTGNELRVYIDGALRGRSEATGKVNLSVESRWVLGRNEEFPGQRAFNGYIGLARVFSEPLPAKDILYYSQERK